MMDPSAHKKDQTGAEGSLLTANLINLGSAFFGALYFLMNAKNVKEFPVCTMFVYMYSHVFMINSTLAKLTDPEMNIFSFDV